jgi:hypothetical protein
MRLTVLRAQKAPGACLVPDCDNPAERLPGTDLPQMLCKPCRERADIAEQEIRAMNPAYGRYMEGKED